MVYAPNLNRRMEREQNSFSRARDRKEGEPFISFPNRGQTKQVDMTTVPVKTRGHKHDTSAWAAEIIEHLQQIEAKHGGDIERINADFAALATAFEKRHPGGRQYIESIVTLLRLGRAAIPGDGHGEGK